MRAKRLRQQTRLAQFWQSEHLLLTPPDAIINHITIKQGA